MGAHIQICARIMQFDAFSISPVHMLGYDFGR